MSINAGGRGGKENPVSISMPNLPLEMFEIKDELNVAASPFTDMPSSWMTHRPSTCLGSWGWFVMFANSGSCSEMMSVPDEVSSRSPVRSSLMSNELDAFGLLRKIWEMGVRPSVDSLPYAVWIALLIGDRFMSSNARPMIPTAPSSKKAKSWADEALMNAK